MLGTMETRPRLFTSPFMGEAGRGPSLSADRLNIADPADYPLPLSEAPASMDVP